MSTPQPSPYPYYSSQPSHSHDKFVAAIIIVAVLTAAVAGGIGYGLGSVSRTLGTSPQPKPTSFTYTHGSVNIGRSGSQYTPFAIYFDNQYTGTLASTIFSGGTYQLYLPSGNVYQVTIYWYQSSFSGTTLQNCTARPSPFTPTGSSYTQEFLC